MILHTTHAYRRPPLFSSWSNLRAVILENLPDDLDLVADRIVEKVLARIANLRQEDPCLVAIDDLAKATSLSTSTLRRLKSDGRIPHVSIGNAVRFCVVDVITALKSQGAS
jgi:predicted DNA-binding transcriptional regulator AlpA